MTGDMMTTEPVRLSGWTALTVGIALNAVLGWALNLDVRAIVASATVMALTSIGGLEWARSRVTPVPTEPAEDGHADLGAVVTVLVIVVLVLLILRLL
jgi:hypothetical protein